MPGKKSSRTRKILGLSSSKEVSTRSSSAQEYGKGRRVTEKQLQNMRLRKIFSGPNKPANGGRKRLKKPNTLADFYWTKPKR